MTESQRGGLDKRNAILLVPVALLSLAVVVTCLIIGGLCAAAARTDSPEGVARIGQAVLMFGAAGLLLGALVPAAMGRWWIWMAVVALAGFCLAGTWALGRPYSGYVPSDSRRNAEAALLWVAPSVMAAGAVAARLGRTRLGAALAVVAVLVIVLFLKSEGG